VHVPRRDVLAADPRDDREGEPLAQATLGVRVLAGPLPLDREPVSGQVERDQVSAAQRRVGRIGIQPLGDLRQLGGELFLGRRLALLPLAVLVPDRPPAAVFLAGRVHRDPVLRLDHRAAARVVTRPVPLTSDRPDAVRPGFACLETRLRASCGDFVGKLLRGDACCAMAIPSLPALSQVRGLTMEA
jgi:hypothetical protein